MKIYKDKVEELKKQMQNISDYHKANIAGSNIFLLYFSQHFDDF